MSRGVVAVALTESERALVVSAVEALVERDGPSQASEDVLEMLAHPLPPQALQALREVVPV